VVCLLKCARRPVKELGCVQLGELLNGDEAETGWAMWDRDLLDCIGVGSMEGINKFFWH
jgi:hypothetical protein